MCVSIEQAKKILHEHWGFSEFRSHQIPVIESVLQGQDTLAILPTSGGKSLCFQVPALCKEGICLVISPLIALMNDQVHYLRKKNIPAASLNSNVSKAEVCSVWNQCKAGWMKLLYVSPERLTNDTFMEMVAALPINLIAVDEAHCISHWGFDFRPSYLKIQSIRNIFPHTPIIALTATATSRVEEDICTYLSLHNPKIIRLAPFRDNLHFQVHSSNEINADVVEYIKSTKTKGSVIVYANTRKQTEVLAERIQKQGGNAVCYHAGMTSHERQEIEKNFLKNKTQIIIATSAFGMGIDKPDVRFVMHAGMPESIESYYQQAGRAGRDGKPAHCILFANHQSMQDAEKKMEKKFPPIRFINSVWDHLQAYASHHFINEREKEFTIVLHDFFNTLTIPPVDGYHALEQLRCQGLIEVFTDRYITASFVFKVEIPVLRQYMTLSQKINDISDPLLRIYPAVGTETVAIDLAEIAARMHKGEDEIHEDLSYLHTQGLGTYIPEFLGTTIRLLDTSKKLDGVLYHKLKDIQKKRLQAMFEYTILRQDRCRQSFFCTYFDTPRKEKCGKCDHCLSAAAPHDITHTICGDIEGFILGNGGDVSMEKITHYLNTKYTKTDYLDALTWLEKNGQLVFDTTKYVWKWIT